MRISYWSSDVCSSDLFPFRKHSATMWVDFVWVRARWSRYRQALVKRARDAGEDTLCAYLHADHIVARRRLEHLPDAWEIGRAACRERVCRYGLDSVVAVSLKQKRKIKQIAIIRR